MHKKAVRHIVLLASLLILVSSCRDTSTANKVAEESVLSYADTSYMIQAWQGTINGKIPVLMWYRIKDSILTGSLFYTEQTPLQAIKLIGTIKNNRFRMLEFTPNGNITGVWIITPKSSSAEGSWFSPRTRKSMHVSMMHIDTAVTIEDINDVNTINGEYAFSYGAKGHFGNMSVKALTNESITVSFSNFTDAPARNMAIIEDDTIGIQNNIATYSSTEYGVCEFQIRFYNGFAVVSYLNNNDNCGFGHNASVEGIYIK